MKINKEIQRYQESILFGLSLRQMVFALLAIGVAVGAYFGLKPLIGAAAAFLLTTACPQSDSYWRSSDRRSSARERLHIIRRIYMQNCFWIPIPCGRC